MAPRTADRITCALAALIFFPLVLASAAHASPSVVVDVASGQVLQQEQATASWYPASLTKLMTTYVALDAVRQKRITLDTPLVVSPRATRMSPSKMGFRPGTEVTLRNALIMLMVKSANDVAVTIAEGVSGSVDSFADEMNRASATLGMTQSQWVNPNGLPDSRQVTSARDLAILGRALLTEFPDYAWLYNIGAMQIGNKIVPTHNGLLGRYPGADGMKTGFTCPAGFNLVASATHGGRKLVAVVLGAPTAGSRTAKAAALLDRAFQSGNGMGPVAALPSFGVAAAPDMRETVCHHRGKATAEFMAEVEDLSIPIEGGAATGVPLLDALGGSTQQRINVKDIARLPRPQVQPLAVFVGRAPGYEGPIARARAPGAPVGEQPDLAAFAEDKPVSSAASPLAQAAPDARPLRGRHARAKAIKAVTAKIEAEPDIAVPEGDDGARRAHGVKAKGKLSKAQAKKPEGKKVAARTIEKKVTHKGEAARHGSAKPEDKKNGKKEGRKEAKQAATQVADEHRGQPHASKQRAGGSRGAKHMAKKPEQ